VKLYKDGYASTIVMLVEKDIFGNWTKHYNYAKSCLSKPHYLATKVPKLLIYNYTTTKAWKYKQSMNKMLC
jgi:hypothetical protein